MELSIKRHSCHVAINFHTIAGQSLKLIMYLCTLVVVFLVNNPFLYKLVYKISLCGASNRIIVEILNLVQKTYIVKSYIC